jgi:hypothetical protein
VGSSYALKGNAGRNDAVVPLALSMPSANTVTVQYATIDAGALQGVDYASTTGTVTFPAGTTSGNLVVPVIGGRLARGNKSFKVFLSMPTGALLGAPLATILIRDPNLAQTVLAMSSQTGDYIGLGQEYLITPSDGNFTFSTLANVITMQANNGDYWETDFAGPSSARLTKGAYPNAQRYPFQPAGTPGLSVYGAGRGCNTLTGNFNVLKAGYTSAGALQSFAADFEQHCEGQAPALFGWCASARSCSNSP